MCLAHLWATEYAAPPELGFTGQRCSTNMSPLRGWEHSLWSSEAKPLGGVRTRWLAPKKAGLFLRLGKKGKVAAEKCIL